MPLEDHRTSRQIGQICTTHAQKLLFPSFDPVNIVTAPLDSATMIFRKRALIWRPDDVLIIFHCTDRIRMSRDLYRYVLID